MRDLFLIFSRCQSLSTQTRTAASTRGTAEAHDLRPSYTMVSDQRSLSSGEILSSLVEHTMDPDHDWQFPAISDLRCLGRERHHQIHAVELIFLLDLVLVYVWDAKQTPDVNMVLWAYGPA